MQFIIYSLAIIPWSWILGMLINRFVEKKNFYPRISKQVFLKRDSLNKALGVDAFKRVVKNTFFKHLNQKIKITSRPTVAELNQLRKEMIFSEMSHLLVSAWCWLLSCCFSCTTKTLSSAPPCL